jgi:NAD-dependent DNA ligase
LETQPLIVTEKLDGTSALLIYNKGHLSIAYSRGNGYQGADITRHVRQIRTVPSYINSAPEYLAIRAECIMKNETFTKYQDDYKNPRNFVAGCMNRKVTEPAILADIDLIAYEIVESSDNSITSKTKMLTTLTSYGFTVASNKKITNPLLVSDIDLEKYVSDFRNSSPYELDGIVITVDNFNSVESLSTADSLNPEHSVKFKINEASSIVNTKVVDVLWEVSKSGFLKPRVQVEPVELFGTTVTYATGFNGKFIKENGIGPGAVVKITKSGAVIPFLISTEVKVDPKFPDCEFEWNETGVEIIVKGHNKDMAFKSVLHFFESMKIDQLKEASLKKIFDKYSLYDESFEDAVYTVLSLTPPEWKMVIGANGAKINSSMEESFAEASLFNIVGPTPFFGFGVGRRKIEMILEQLDVEEDFWYLTEARLSTFFGFDEKTSTKIIGGLDRANNFYTKIKNSFNFQPKKQTNKTSELSGVVAVFTGFRDAGLEAKIKSKGGSVVSGVSKKVTHVVCIDPKSGSNKIQKAKTYGATVISLNDFKKEYGL